MQANARPTINLNVRLYELNMENDARGQYRIAIVPIPDNKIDLEMLFCDF